MNNGAFGENFPYSNFHDLNMDWIIKIAKDFLDQYTHIQDVIDTGLNDLDEKATQLQNLLQEWYDTHSEDIQNELADALSTINAQLNTVLNTLNTDADAKLAQVLASIPDDYTALSNKVVMLDALINGMYTNIPLSEFVNGTISFADAGRTNPRFNASNAEQILFLYNCSAFSIDVLSGTLYVIALDRSTGAWGSAETFIAGTNATKTTLTDYFIIHNGTITNSMNVYAITRDYNYGSDNYSHFVPGLVNNMNNTKLFQAIYSNRVSTGIFEANDFHFITEDNNLRALVFYTNENDIWTATPWTNQYNRTTSYTAKYLLVFKNQDNTEIKPVDVIDQIELYYGIKTNKVEVVHFTSKVYNQTGTGYEDEGILVLPENYSPDGEPVRLAIVCHGSGTSRYGTATIDENGKILGDPQRVLTKMGFAVMDTFAAPYGMFGSYSGLHYGCPIVLPCYKSAIEHVLQNYNVKKTGIAVFGSSMGALSAVQIAMLSGYDISSCVLYSPCLDLYKQAWSNPWINTTRSSIAQLYSFSGTAPADLGTSFPPSEEVKEYFIDNLRKTMGMNPITFDADFIYEDLCDVFPSSATGLNEPAEKAIYEQSKKFFPCPILIFHCKDDTVVAYRYSEYFERMCNNGGSFTTLIGFNTGGHNSWNTGAEVTLYDVNGNAFTCTYSQAQGYRWARSYGKD